MFQEFIISVAEGRHSGSQLPPSTQEFVVLDGLQRSQKLSDARILPDKDYTIWISGRNLDGDGTLSESFLSYRIPSEYVSFTTAVPPEYVTLVVGCRCTCDRFGTSRLRKCWESSVIPSPTPEESSTPLIPDSDGCPCVLPLRGDTCPLGFRLRGGKCVGKSLFSKS